MIEFGIEKVIDLVAETIENVAKDYFNDEKITVKSIKKAIKGALVEVGIGSIPLPRKYTKRINKAAERIAKLKPVVKMRGNNSKYGRQLSEAQAEKFVEGAKQKTQEIIKNATGESSGNYTTKDD
ncbi:hypothetical protein [Flavobacterium sp. CLA17]|uniref:hypothetical protein n=1 Tax=Flavobacterium sp. CLA17 TaxID=2724135 RepID=UPI001490D96A|nr:hypothetical protein [Flavobacterium sp. CLA17]QSB26483.1 hypothetical protein HAV12_019270 [Flavobacterium sp. CLA17]